MTLDVHQWPATYGADSQPRMGFFTDTSICIGCKACEVACKEWNQLQGDEPNFLADSYDNTGQLDAQNWRHVKFIDQVPTSRQIPATARPS